MVSLSTAHTHARERMRTNMPSCAWQADHVCMQTLQQRYRRKHTSRVRHK